MGYRRNRKRSNGRRSKLHTVRQRRRTSKNHSCLSSCVHRCVGGEAVKKMQIMKALDFGIQSGYLVPTDKTYRILHVSSDLLRKQTRKSRMNLMRNYKRIGSNEDSWNLREREKNEVGKKNRMNPKYEEYPVQEGRRRRSRSKRGRSRKRSRSRSRNKRRRSSRRRSRGRRSSNNSEKIGEDDDDYEQEENTTKRNSRNEHTTDNNDSRNSRSKSPDVDKTNIEKSPDDISDVSLDDDDSDDEEDKNKTNAS